MSTSCLLPFSDAKTGKQYPVIRKTPLGKKVIFLVVIILVKHFGIYILLRLFWISFCFSYCYFLLPVHLTGYFYPNFESKIILFLLNGKCNDSLIIILLRKWYSYFLTVKKESKLNFLTLRNHSYVCLSYCNVEFPDSYYFSMNLINSFIYL